MYQQSVLSRYQQDGFIFPLKAMSELQAEDYRYNLESVESNYRKNPDYLYALNGGINFVLPLVDEITTRPEILDQVEEMIGPDIVVFSASLFIKEAQSPQYVSWHQDLTYWGLSGAEEVTAWVALSPATVESGCMRMIPGSHRYQLVAHTDTFKSDNLLTRGQQLAVNFDESEAVDVVLAPGEFSLHHGYTFHGSRPNLSNNRRIGLSISYVSTSMRLRSGVKPVTRLARGSDSYGHFEFANLPKGVFDAGDVAAMRRAKDIAESFYYQGTERRLATDVIGKDRMD